MRISHIYYYTLGEVLKIDRIANINLQSKLNELVTAWNQQTGFTYNQITISETSNMTKLINEYLIPKYYNENVVMMPCKLEFFNSEDYDQNIDDYIEFLVSFVEFLKSSSTRYDIMISLFNEKKNKLLDSLTTTNTTRFNDTPQNDGSYEDESHNTTVTKTETSSPIVASTVSKLNEVNNNLRDVFEQWSLEFENKFIIWSSNI